MKRELQNIAKKLGKLVDLQLEERKDKLPDDFYSWEKPDNYYNINTIKKNDRLSGIYEMNYAGIKKIYWYKPYRSQYLVRKVDGDLVMFSKADGKNWSSIVEIATKDYFINCIKTT